MEKKTDQRNIISKKSENKTSNLSRYLSKYMKNQEYEILKRLNLKRKYYWLVIIKIMNVQGKQWLLKEKHKCRHFRITPDFSVRSWKSNELVKMVYKPAETRILYPFKLSISTDGETKTNKQTKN